MARHVVVDTGPVVSALTEAGPGPDIARRVLAQLGRTAIVTDAVAIEVDMMLRRRTRAAGTAARRFWADVNDGVHRRLHMTRDLWLRAAEIDEQFADLDIGAVDAAVAAAAESLDAPVFTWDFRDFGPLASGLGLRLLVDRGGLGLD